MEKLSTSQLATLQAAKDGALQWVFPRNGNNGGFRMQNTPGCPSCGTTPVRVTTGQALLSRGLISRSTVPKEHAHYTAVIITHTGEVALEHANA